MSFTPDVSLYKNAERKNSAGIHLNGKFTITILEGKHPYIKIHISPVKDSQIFNSKKVMVGLICDECHFHHPSRSTEAESNLLCFGLKVLPAIYLASDAIMQ